MAGVLDTLQQVAVLCCNDECLHGDAPDSVGCGDLLPSSVSSLTARFRNLQECVERNHETLQSHRHDLDMVVKMRQERVQRLADDLLQSVKNMYEQREAKRNSA